MKVYAIKHSVNEGLQQILADIQYCAFGIGLNFPCGIKSSTIEHFKTASLFHSIVTAIACRVMLNQFLKAH